MTNPQLRHEGERINLAYVEELAFIPGTFRANLAMASRGLASKPPDAPIQRPTHSGSRPPQPNLLHNPDDVSDSDEEEPPPYTRYDPLAQPQPQARPPPQNVQHPPRPEHQRPYPGSPQNSYNNGYPAPAPQQPFTPPAGPRGYPSPPAGQYPPPFQHHPPKFQQPPTPFQYPPGYYCPKCHNTGFKVYNGSPCGTCARLFGRQTADVLIN